MKTACAILELHNNAYMLNNMYIRACLLILLLALHDVLLKKVFLYGMIHSRISGLNTEEPSMKHLVTVVCCILALCLCLTASSLAETREQRRFDEAMSQLAIGNYAQAAETFSGLGAFEQASYWAMYARGLNCVKNSNWSQAYAIFTALGDFQDSRMRKNYDLQARSYEALELYEEANKIYEQYPWYLDFEDRIADNLIKIKERDYKKADQSEERGNLEAAYSGFQALVPYKDSAARASAVQDKIKAVAYVKADEEEKAGHTLQALSAFGELIPYKDSENRVAVLREKICEESYAKADEFEQKGQLLSAYQMFVTLRDNYQYKDSAERADAIWQPAMYEQGLQQIAKGNYQDALKTYTDLNNYRDSKAKVYALGVTAFAEDTKKLTDHHFAYCYHDVWGLVNTESATVNPARWKHIDVLNQQLFTVSTGSILGISGTNGEVLISPRFSKVSVPDAYGIIQVTEKGKIGLINTSGEVIVKPQYSSISSFDSNGLAQIVSDQKVGIITKTGSVLVEPKYSAISTFDHHQLATITLQNKVGIINAAGGIVAEPVYGSIKPFGSDGESNLAKAVREGKFGYLNTDGEEAIPCQWLEISSFRDGICTVAQVSDQGIMFGLVDKTGKTITEPQWRAIGESMRFANQTTSAKIGAPDYSEGFIRAMNTQKRWVLLDRNGTILGGRDWDVIGTFHEGYADVKNGRLYGFIRADGEVIAEPTYVKVEPFSEGLAAVQGTNHKWGFLSETGELAIDIQYTQVTSFEDGRADVYFSDEGWHIIDRTGIKWYVATDAYLRAESLLAAGQYQEAAEAYEAIAGDASAMVRGQMARYRLAEEDLAAGNVDKAKENFLLAGEYRDAPLRSKAIYYTEAEEKLAQGEREEAIELFKAAVPYTNAEERLAILYYEDAKVLFEKGDLKGALEFFQQCGNLSDAQHYVRSIHLSLAAEARATGNWEEAVAEYIAAGDDDETRQAVRDVRIAQAKTLTEQGAYDEALAVLDVAENGDDWSKSDGAVGRPKSMRPMLLASAVVSDSPLRASSDSDAKMGNDPEIAELRRQILLKKAEDQAQKGDYTGAEETYLSVGERLQALQARVRHASRLLTEKKWEDADALLVQGVEAYPEFNAQMQEVRYQEGLIMKRSGAYQQATRVLKELGAYSDAADQATDSQYLYAKSLMATEAYDQAEELLGQIKDYQDAAEQIKECRYLRAGQYLARGETEAAMQIYQEMPDYKDVDDILHKNPDILRLIAVWQEALKPGDIVSFGHRMDEDSGTIIPMQWVILDREDNYAFLLADSWSEKRPFMDYTSVHVTWQHSSLRAYLNDTFLKEHFTDDEQAHIRISRVKTLKPTGVTVSPGNDTEDYVYILSQEEVAKSVVFIKGHAALNQSGICWTRSPYDTGKMICFWADTLRNSAARLSTREANVCPVLWVDMHALFE